MSLLSYDDFMTALCAWREANPMRRTIFFWTERT